LSLPVILAGVFFAGDLFFWHLSILATTVANATFLATTSPIWVALGAWLLLSERIGTRMLFGLLLCIAGGFALIGESYGFAPQRVRGDIFGLCTAVFFGAYILAMRAARAGTGAARLAFLSTAVTAGILFVIAILFDATIIPGSWSGAAALLALALVSQVGGQGLLSVALGSLPATFSALVIFLEAIAAAGFGWIVLGEALGWAQALGGILILLGIWTARPRVGAAR
jgi:drug/metabolite transporter (DMT)-like permease